MLVKLVPLSADHVQGHPFLPFHVYAEDGRLLLPANAQLNDPRVQARLAAQGSLFVQQQDYDAWRRGMARVVDGAMHDNRSLGQLARARTDPLHNAVPQLPGEEWEGLVMALHSALQALGMDKPWLPRVLELHARARALAARRVDEALFHLIWTGGNRTSFYSCRQSLRCMFIAGEAARGLGWDDERVALLDKAALTMNVASWRQQDQLARRPQAVAEAEERVRLQAHPQESAQLLQAAGVSDAAWLDAVRHHHDDALSAQPLAQLTPGQQMALLLRRVDRYGAMLSRRSGREAQTATAAAQRACLGPDGRPDEVGAVLLKAMGLYPPGSFVTLASKEIGIVLARGATPTQPMVAALLNAQGMAMAEPRLRDTSQGASAVRGALRHSQVSLDPPLEKLQVLRAFLRAQAAAAHAG
jgi:hypothetical protein